MLAHKKRPLIARRPTGHLQVVGEQRKLEEAERRGLVATWSREPGWISLHDPLTGEWHDWPAADCFPSIVTEANSCRKMGGAA